MDCDEDLFLRVLAIANGIFVSGLTQRRQYIASSLVERGLAYFDTAIRISEIGRMSAAEAERRAKARI